ncbi:hypothetical protein [Streptomyces flavochromogenes]|uniref:hypothetical protein n=1 Tax=Streptomyces flavochromogenes TaxID=68199 RepID=UPI0004C2927A|nr:hypothetical protein [Streptomyces flavochromogenes]
MLATGVVAAATGSALPTAPAQAEEVNEPTPPAPREAMVAPARRAAWLDTTAASTDVVTRAAFAGTCS